MKKLVRVAAAAMIVLASPAAASPPAAAAPAGHIAWSPCPDDDPVMGGYLQGLECGTLQVPLDHARPQGEKITIALTRARHTSPDAQYQGVVLLNRGQWPGSAGRDLPSRFANGFSGLPVEVGATYDWIGFDPRGVGASEPMVTCDPTHLYSGQARPDYVPSADAAKPEWLGDVREFAKSCGRKYGDTLRYLSTKDTARDMDLIRQALGQKEINYLGYSYGTYIGSVYASMFPQRVRRMVLDSVVRPSGVWYDAGLEQNEAFERRAEIYFGWIAKYDSVYHLGTTTAQVEANYYKGMEMVRAAPIDGKIGPAEYTDIFSVNMYRTYVWAYHAQVLADWVLRKDPTGLRNNHGGEPDYPAQNTFATYSAVQCSDAAWPRSWRSWQSDHSRQYKAGNTIRTWYNAWHNAPCAFWPTPASTPQSIGHRGVNILLVQPEHDALTPLSGAQEVHSLFPNSRFVLELGGVFHGSSLTANANACVNGHVIDYLRDGTRPSSKPGADATCEANPTPDPTT